MKSLFLGFKVMIVISIGLIFSAVGFAQQEPCETASKFGADDQIGNLNYVTPEKTLAASKLVTKGKSYSLAIVTTTKHTPCISATQFFNYRASTESNRRSIARTRPKRHITMT